jgi:acetate---CoA ligase (ADP-forming)
MQARLARLLSPASIAIIGASPDPTKMGTRCLAQIQRHGYPGQLHPIHRTADDVLGIPTSASLASLETAPDLVIVSVPASAVPEVIAECGAIGAGAALVLSSGFAETGHEGAALQLALQRAAEQFDIAVLGPNSNGLAAMHLPLVATSNPALNAPPVVGGLAIVSQTGGIGLGSIQHMANQRRIGLSHNISTGNEAVLGTSEFIDYLVTDDRTEAIAVISEGIRNGPAFLAAARRARSVGKPIVMMKLGRTERGGRLTQSHTGMLAGDFEIQAQALREAGVIVVDDIDAVLEVSTLSRSLSARGISGSGLGVGIVSPSGGAAVLASDLCTEAGVTVADVGPTTSARLAEILPAYAAASNPVDLTATGTYHVQMHIDAITALANDPATGVVLCILTVSANFDDMLDGIVAGIGDVAAPIVFAGLGGAQSGRGFETLEAAGYLVFRSLGAAAQALRTTLLHAGHGVGREPHPTAPIPAPERVGVEVVADWDQGPQDEHASKRLLNAYGIGCVDEEVVTASTAAAVARRIGFPVVLKAMVSGLTHKSEAGGVELDLADEASVAAAVTRMEQRFGGEGSGVRLLMQPMLRGLSEMIVGITTDPHFGKVVLVGAGGTTTEILRDRSLRLAPVTQAEAEEMVRELRSFPLLDGFRGRPRAAIEELARIISRVSELAIEWDDRLEELDLNPVLVGEQSALALDALIVWR